MTKESKKIADLELQIEFYKNEIDKCNKTIIELEKQLTLAGVGKSCCDNLEIDLGDKNCIHCGVHISEHKRD